MPPAGVPADSGRLERFPPPLIDSAALFAGNSEIWIDHNGERYRLQRTKAGKLILTK